MSEQVTGTYRRQCPYPIESTIPHLCGDQHVVLLKPQQGLDWSYIAGFFDGEGMVVFQKRGQRELRFYNTHRETIVAIQTFIGCGAIYTRHWKNPKWKPSHILEVGQPKDVLRVARCLLPHSITKVTLLQRVIEDLENRGIRNDV